MRKKGQKTPNGYYNIERLVRVLAAREQRSPCGSRGSTWFWMERKRSPA